MPDAVDRHFTMVDEQESIQKMKDAIKVLQDANVDFTIEGGWAVTAYGSNVASVDLDVLVPGGLTPEIAEAIESATGYQIYSQVTQETLALEFVDADHANDLIDRPSLKYLPSEILKGQTEELEILPGVVAKVPSATVLVFMKLKAFHDRRLQWQAARGERFLISSFKEEERERTINMGEAHWLRKAGKDLFDAAYLLRDHTSLEEVEKVAPADVWAKVKTSLNDIPLPIRAFAENMAKRAKIGDLPLP
ncbi:MAG: nucleotidyltransferase domain-containing protein [Thermoplasmatota archaeon]